MSALLWVDDAQLNMSGHVFSTEEQRQLVQTSRSSLHYGSTLVYCPFLLNISFSCSFTAVPILFRFFVEIMFTLASLLEKGKDGDHALIIKVCGHIRKSHWKLQDFFCLFFGSSRRSHSIIFKMVKILCLFHGHFAKQETRQRLWTSLIGLNRFTNI